MNLRLPVLAITVLSLGLPRVTLAGDYIVVLRDDVGPAAVKDGGSPAAVRRAVEAAARRHRAVPSFVYAHALRGYAATLSDAALARAQADPAVAFVAEDRELSLPEPAGKGGSTFPIPNQGTPFGVQRIGGKQSPTAKIDKIDERVDIDVAILDTGVQADHPDLNVVGGMDCQHKGGQSIDDNGHGTHVAGIAAAIDNAYGVVGVAPGARIWGVKVLTKHGKGRESAILCGIDWVTTNANIIDVANMSLSGGGSDDGNGGLTKKDAMHLAICNSVAAGITYAVAAGNAAADAATEVPASYDEVITASAIADFNGQPGGGAPVRPGCTVVPDDTFAFFSNFGSDVDIAAPGVCVTSTYIGSLYANITGTSMAAPHVAGAAALYKATHPSASPAEVKAALIAAWEPGPIPGDPDSFPEGVVNVSTF